MRRGSGLAFVLLLCCQVEQTTSESEFAQTQEQPLFMAVPASDPEFVQARSNSRRSLPVFRKLIAPAYPSSETIRMVKTHITEGDDDMWLWVNVEVDAGNGFDTSVFEAPPEFPSLEPGTHRFVRDEEIADWAVIDKDGVLNGGYSLRLARSKLPEAEKGAYDSYIGVKVYAPLPSN